MGSITPQRQGEITLNNNAASSTKSAAINLESALSTAHADYLKTHAKSKSQHDEACKFMPGGNTRTVLHTSPFPLAISSAQSCYLTTLDGQTYIDFLGEYTAGIYGHNHPVIRQAIESALDKGWNYGGQTEVEARLARTVVERFGPSGMEMVRFVNSGTEANMMAIATAIAFTRKKKVLLFEKGYHGSTISGRSAISAKNSLSVNLPHQFLVGKYNNVQEAEDLVKRSCSKEDEGLAAIIVEPMLGSGGCYVADTEFLACLRRLADEYGALLIFDEVMTSRLAYNGFSSTLFMPGGHATPKPPVRPDLMTLGKWVGGGMSFGAFGGRKDVMAIFDPRSTSSPEKVEHPGTFNNNVFSMTAGVAGCSLLTKDVLERLNMLGDSMRKAIEDVLQSHDIVSLTKGHRLPKAPVLDDRDTVCLPTMFIKGVGSLMAIQFAGPQKETLQVLFFHHMLSKGIYMAQRGFVAMSIEIQQEHVKKFVEAVDEFCAKWKEALA